jgi:ATP-dependent RNA helicase DeaD
MKITENVIQNSSEIQSDKPGLPNTEIHDTGVAAQVSAKDKFASLTLPEPLVMALKKLNFTTMTPVQTQTISSVLKGRDAIVAAPTGTGKTLAFCLPLLAQILANRTDQALIVAPTRELAAQILTVFQSLLGFTKGVHGVLLIGGMPMARQLSQLRRNPNIIVGTPGRINDHLQRKSLQLRQVKHVVLDEIDRMLDMGFSVQIDEVFKHLPETRQMLMFSATVPPEIHRLAKKYLQDPVRVSIETVKHVNENIKQEFLHLEKDKKYAALALQLAEREGSVMVFVKTKRASEQLAKQLREADFKAAAIHGDLRQHQRDRVIRRLRNREHRIVVATDVAARGIDVPHIKHVINYNLPMNPEDYVHRVGRTGRAGMAGHSLCFVSQDERKEWHALEVFLDPSKKRARNPQPSKWTQTKKKYGHRGKFSGNFPGYTERERPVRKSKGPFSSQSSSRPGQRSSDQRPGQRSDQRSSDQRPGQRSSDQRPEARSDSREGPFKRAGKPFAKRRFATAPGESSGGSGGDRREFHQKGKPKNGTPDKKNSGSSSQATVSSKSKRAKPFSKTGKAKRSHDSGSASAPASKRKWGTFT